ncbi:MAG: hypothetical protein KJ598_00665, partial [Nanoarchaeota archaeon]|nr:hypothetical protein [Nanoarchaeota archaeon]MBU1643650.1 hypothetical protein [Nanoarchaeota archaeon]
MLSFFKKIFQKEPLPLPEELKPEELEDWLKKQAGKISFNLYLKEYLRQIKEIKVQLAEGLKKLKDQEISEADQKQVEARIKNIVIGHKNNYTNEIEHF